MLAAIRKPPAPSAEFLRPYTEQMKRLLPEDAGLALLGADGTVYWSSLERPPPVDERVLDRLAATAAPLQLDCAEQDVLLAVLPVLRHGVLVAAVLLRLAQRIAEPPGAPLDRLWRRLRPTLDRLGRELAWSVAGAPGDAVFAQRIVPLTDPAKTRGIECLARLVAEDGEAVPPADFLCAAQRYQLSRAVDEWIVRHALGAAQPYSSLLQHGPIHLSLNLSEQSLHDDEFLGALEDRLVRSRFGPGLVMLEITEAVALRNAARTEMLARRLKRLGCRLALDDFGASGHSASLLASLKPDCVKIDGAHVRGLLVSPQAQAMVRRAMMLAAAHRVECVATHAETVAITRRLAEIGVGFAQGNAIHQAEPLTALLESLAVEESQELRRLYLQ